MPHDSVPRIRRRRLAALAAISTLGAALVPVMVFTPTAAVATTPCVPASFTANASADLLKLTLLDVGPLGLLHGPIANVTIGHATADMAHAHPLHATGAADYLSATLAGITVPPSLLNTHAQQDAPPAHASADTHSLVALNSGLLDLGVGNVKASAGRTGPYSCSLATADASVADAAVLSGLGGHSLLSLPTNLNGNAGAGLIKQGGHIASAAEADAGLAELHLFGGTDAEVGVKVVTEPTLKGIATGSAGTSSVTYTSPVLDVTLPGGAHVRLDGVHTHLDMVTGATAGAVSELLGSLNLPLTQDLPLLNKLKKRNQIELRLTIGELTKHVGATSVSGEAATLRLQLLLARSGTRSGIAAHATSGSVTLLDLGIGDLSVAASAPAATTPPGGGYGSPAPCASPGGGYGHSTACPTPSPSTSTVPVTERSGPPSPAPSSVHATATRPASLPLTGSRTTWVLGAGVMLLVVGRLLMVIARRRMAE
jgi:LPXTG-motif cell wall-anchored protein